MMHMQESKVQIVEGEDWLRHARHRQLERFDDQRGVEKGSGGQLLLIRGYDVGKDGMEQRDTEWVLEILISNVLVRTDLLATE